MPSVRYARMSVSHVLLLVAALAMTGCGEISNEVEPVTYQTVKHVGGGNANILKVTEYLGPAGAKPGRVKPGRYVLKGTYDLTGTSHDGGVIRFGFLGNANVKSEACKTEQQVEKGKPQGTFELTMFVTKWKEGDGTPLASYVVGSDAYDSIEIY